MRSISRTMIGLLFSGCAVAAHGQQDTAPSIPIRQLATEATSRDTVGYLYGIRELSDGRVLANDAANRRLILFDRALSRFTVVADSSTGGDAASYGKRPTGIIPYLGDSTLLIDQAARSFLVLDGDGKVARIMSPPRPYDVQYMWNPALGTPGFDAKGRVIYRGWIMPAMRLPEAGKKYEPPEMPDSAPVLRGDFDRRAADTIAWIRIPKMRVSVAYLPGGAVSLSSKITPLATIDDWTALPDGGVAILRGQDYHVDWILADGSRASSPKMPFDWKRLTDEEKSAIVDSTKKQLARAMASPGAGGVTAGVGGVPVGHSMTLVPAGASGDGPAPHANTTPPPPRPPEVVEASELPDYMPPIVRSGVMRADGEGNVWILPSTSRQSSGGLLYDVVDRTGRLAHRVRLPAGRALEGFGRDGAIYLTSHDASGSHLERARLISNHADSR